MNINTWAGRCKKWSDCSNLTWGELIVINDILIAIDSGKGSTGNVNTTFSKVQNKINKLTEPEKKKVISVLVKLHAKNFKQTKEIRNGIEITVDDVEFILKEVKNIKINILKD